MTFRVGQKVICVDASPNPEGESLSLKMGATYTIKAVAKLWSTYGVQVFEAVAPETRMRAPFFNATRFRPIVEQKTDISVFTRMLTPNSKEKVRA